MSTTVAPLAISTGMRARSLRGRFQDILPRMVLAPSFVLVLVFVYGFNLWTFFLSFTNSKGFTSTKLDRPRQLPEALELDLRDRPAVELVHGDRQHGHFRRTLCRVLPDPRPHARDPARPEDSRRRHPAPDLSLSARAVVHRHRHGVEALPRSGHRARESRPRLGLDELQVRLGRQSPHDDLLRRDRRHLADLGFRDGDVPGRACAASTAKSSRRRRSTAPRRSPPIGASCSRSCARCSSPPSSCSPIWRSNPTTSCFR